MATTIGRMAVVLTSDTTRFDAGFQRAGATIRTFRGQVDRHNSSMLGMGRSTDVARASMGVLRGNVLGLTGALIGSGGMVFALAAGAAALVKFGRDAAEAANKAENARVVLEERTAQVLSQQGRTIKVAANELEKSREELEKENIRMGGMINRVFTEFNKVGAKARRDFFDTFTNIPKSGQESTRFVLKGRNLTTDELKAWVKQQEQLQKEAAAHQEKMLHDFREFQRTMSNLSERLNDSLRTPAEIFADTVNELQSVFQHGGLSPEKLARGIAQAQKELVEAAKSAAATAKSFRDLSVPALDRNTTAGFSGAMQARMETERLVKLQEQELAIAKEAKRVQEEGFRKLLEKEPIVFQRGSL